MIPIASNLRPYCVYALLQEKNIRRTNERPTLADREPHSQHFPALCGAHCWYVFWIENYTVFCLLGCNCARYNFVGVNSGYGIMEFVIEEPNVYNRPNFWFAGNSRYETTTDVKFVNDNTLVVANRMAAVLHLVEFDIQAKTFKILDRIRLEYEGPVTLTSKGFRKSSYPKHVDLINVRGNRVYYVSLDSDIGIVDIVNRKFVKRNIITVKDDVYIHGIEFHPSKSNIAYLSGALYKPKLLILDMVTMAKQSVILPGLEGRLVKSARFLDDKHLVVSGGGGLISTTDKNKSYDGYLAVYSLPDFKCLDLVTIELAQTDDVAVYNGFIYSMLQGVTEAKVCKYAFDGKLQKLEEIVVGGFPHGIDARNGILAVTSMSRSSVQLIRI